MCDSTKTDRNRVQIMWLEFKKKLNVTQIELEKQLNIIKSKNNWV